MTELLQPFIPEETDDGKRFLDSTEDIPLTQPNNGNSLQHPFTGTVVETPYPYPIDGDKKGTTYFEGTVKGWKIDNDGPYRDWS